ncbi:MAG: heme-binding protein, partial [Gammaproteobacteria bacterium]|nr:heme-binding protein [Gammaproteobacteria bacterium]
MIKRRCLAFSLLAFMLLGACSGGSPTADPAGTDAGNDCSGSCAGAATVLQVADVETVIAQGVAEAEALGVDATIAVVDRVGNVLAVYRMGAAANREVTVSTSANNPGLSPVTAGLEGIRLPVTPLALNIDDLAAIAKAVTGAYLSSEGNAFSTRTASQIVQDHFNPGERFQPGGPLFGVQFSQLACSDFNVTWNGIGTSPGPHRSPLGLSADPGGFPLYKGGSPVGGVGVIADGVYGADAVITDRDLDVDEMIAYAATFGFAAPQDRRGDQITVEGKVFRFSDVDFAALSSDPASATPFASIPPATGALLAVNGYTDGVIRAGTQFGQNASGIAADPSNLFPGLDAFVLVDAAGTPRYPPIAGTDGGSLAVAPMSANEVQTILQNALDVANRARAQIRRPLGSPARVTISVVDTNGEILGVVRGRDAPMFGADVSLQKARTATFFSSATAASYLNALPPVSYLTTTDSGNGLNFSTPSVQFADYVSAAQAFLADPNALTDGQVAFSDRAGGNLSRPYYPDG